MDWGENTIGRDGNPVIGHTVISQNKCGNIVRARDYHQPIVTSVLSMPATADKHKSQIILIAVFVKNRDFVWNYDDQHNTNVFCNTRSILLPTPTPNGKHTTMFLFIITSLDKQRFWLCFFFIISCYCRHRDGETFPINSHENTAFLITFQTTRVVRQRYSTTTIRLFRSSGTSDFPHNSPPTPLIFSQLIALLPRYCLGRWNKTYVFKQHSTQVDLMV